MNFRGVKGKLVRVLFDDHSIEINEPKRDPIKCKVFGIVHSQTSRLLIVQYWEILNRSKEDKEANKEVVKILKSCITDIKIYDE